MSEYPIKTYPTIGCCGLDCGLCPRYYTAGTSRCPGCCGPDFFNRHPSCSTITCCVKKKQFEVCGECPEFPCSKFKDTEEYRAVETSSYPPYRKIIPNLNYIREHGIQEFIENQMKRVNLLRNMIENFDDGRSRSFYCRAAALLDVESMERSLGQATRRIKAEDIKSSDTKNKAKILKGLLNAVATKEGIELK